MLHSNLPSCLMLPLKCSLCTNDSIVGKAASFFYLWMSFMKLWPECCTFSIRKTEVVVFISLEIGSFHQSILPVAYAYSGLME